MRLRFASHAGGLRMAGRSGAGYRVVSGRAPVRCFELRGPDGRWRAAAGVASRFPGRTSSGWAVHQRGRRAGTPVFDAALQQLCGVEESYPVDRSIPCRGELSLAAYKQGGRALRSPNGRCTAAL